MHKTRISKIFFKNEPSFSSIKMNLSIVIVAYKSAHLLDKVIPFLLKKKIKSGAFVAEDDAYPNDFVTPDFFKKRITNQKYASKYKNKILRVGYQKVLNEKRTGYPRGYYCVGTQLLWIPKSQLLKLKEAL